jgi:hypothetical protein
MKILCSIISVVFLIFAAFASTRDDFQIRDPFVVPDNGVYYLYESKPWYGGDGVFVRTSRDLETWTEKKRVLSIPAGVKCTAVWAPEVHKFNGKYYLFVTLTEEDGVRDIKPMAEGVDINRIHPRGTWIFSSYTPDGEFRPVSDGPVTPKDWVCLDGTLLVDNGKPYIVFCHEWVQIEDGEVCDAVLSDDLTHIVGDIRTLWKASEFKDVVTVIPDKKAFVTDGPYFYRCKSGELICIWSTYTAKGYAELISVSDNGDIDGNWTLLDTPMSNSDGGHGMIFDTFEGNSFFTIVRRNCHYSSDTSNNTWWLYNNAEEWENGNNCMVMQEVDLNRSEVVSPGVYNIKRFAPSNYEGEIYAVLDFAMAQFDVY